MTSLPPSGRRLAITAEALFLANLLALPGLAFLAQAWLWRQHARHPEALARNHLRQTFWVSLWGGALLVLVCLGLVLLGGFHWAGTWVAVILYFTCVHSTLVLFGIVGLARAMAGQSYRYPLIGPTLEDDA